MLLVIMFYPLAESAYVHIPFCRRRCFYCDFPIAVVGNHANLRDLAWVQAYVEALCQEIQATPSQGRSLNTIFFGGGTPSLLPIPELEKILEHLNQKFGIGAEAEISLEIDPGTFTCEQLQNYQRLGVTRLSLGAQAFQDDLLQACGRFHRVADIDQAIAWIKQIGFENWSLDLISGLPHQTLEQWQYSLETAINLSSPHLSCYDLVMESTTVFGKQFHPGEAPLPTDEVTAKMYRQASTILQQSGYEHYEISNYAQSGYQCRHNRVYWENRSYYGFGLGAASYTSGIRFTRPRTRQSYYHWLQEFKQNGGQLFESSLDLTEQLLEMLMLGLRLTEGIPLERFQVFGTVQLEKVLNTLDPYLAEGWITLTAPSTSVTKNKSNTKSQNSIALTDPEGLLFSNTILTALFEAFS
jgi:putative oxygen-independent coproporphyrinogen III oxidase